MNDKVQTLDPAISAPGWDALRRPVWLYDPQSLKGVYANRSALALWGAASLEELLARDFSQLSPAVRTRVERLAQATAGGEEVSERWTFYPNGAPVTVQAAISTVRLSDGRAVLMFEAAPAEVEAQERRAVEALRHTTTVITLFDADGRSVFANPAAFAAYGETEAPFESRFADPERGQALLAQAQSGEPAGDLCEVLTSAGRRWHQMDARPVRDPVTGTLGVLLNERDVTERVDAERARTAAEQKAAMAEAREQFLTEMSHELRTPLNAVIGFSELLASAGLAPAARRQAERIHDAGRRLLTVVEAMIANSQAPPAPPDSSDRADAPIAPAEAEADATRPLRVLCVDDNDSNRALVSAILASQGVTCVAVEDGAQAVAAARDAPWDLILMDIQMPVLNGMDATRAIRTLEPPASDTPILALTANTLPEQLEAYAAAGLDDCLAKPIRPAALIAAVARWTEAVEAADGGARAESG